MCTHLIVKAKNGDVVVARSMDFAAPTGIKTSEWNVGHKINKTVSVAIPFIGKYTENDIAGEAIRSVSDGFNKEGLSVGTLWLPSTTFKNTVVPTGNEVSGLTLTQVLLGTCKTVAEAVAYLKSHTVVLPLKYIDQFATIHIALADKSGASAVVEFGTDGVASSVHVYDNPVGVLTNAPEFPWHLRNLSCYTQIGLFNVESKKFGSYEAKHTGFGANQLGIAGDASPSSRFVRAATLLNAALDHEVPADAAAAKLLLDKVIAQVCVVKGSSGDKGNGLTTKDKFDWTQWVIIKDLTHYKCLLKNDSDLGFAEPKMDSLNGSDEGDNAFQAMGDMSDADLAAFAESFNG